MHAPSRLLIDLSCGLCMALVNMIFFPTEQHRASCMWHPTTYYDKPRGPAVKPRHQSARNASANNKTKTERKTSSVAQTERPYEMGDELTHLTTQK